jgi:glutaredoxin-related protein
VQSYIRASFGTIRAPKIPDYHEVTFDNEEISMAMQNIDNDVKANRDQQRMDNDTGSDDTVGNPATTEDDQQAAMPPSETDDDQYDQGTVQRER